MPRPTEFSPSTLDDRKETATPMFDKEEYDVIKPIGFGNFGEIFLVQDRKTDA